MGYSRQVYIDAENELAKRRSEAQKTAQRRLEQFYTVCPEAENVRRRIASTASQAARAVLRGGNVRASMEALKAENLALQAQFAELLKANGFTRADIDPQYACKHCEDTGFVDGRMCSCHRALLRQIAYENLNRISPLTLSTFEDFSLDYYSNESVNGMRSDREQMRYIFEYCRRYANNLTKESGNLFFTGATGLGKTHLSLAIASAAIDKGFGVVYGTAQNFAVSLERERFARPEDNVGDTLELLNECDLLIIDDLGMEISSSYITSMIYNVIDTRIMLKKPTIISSNLSMQELEKRYNERFVSRVLGFYDRMPFRGKDIRVKRKYDSMR
ncbi:MAG: ATP-binding protein [Oscillospiraceae bacterium]|nr:ATP-binding protein [Oscillospiraceae bacterium]